MKQKSTAYNMMGSLRLRPAETEKNGTGKTKTCFGLELVTKLSRTVRTHETCFEEYKKLSKTKQDEIKDVGGFVGGSLKDGRRKQENVELRQIVSLDADFVKGDLKIR
ncbi:hypothetical protein KHA80_12140 [Anaerobacillus sp. HL2]|nr:hypothetical protein KHA80_12140 [Anaerobacillus sp. HL2]